MSFRLFIYYCAICGAWAALLTWVVSLLTGLVGLGERNAIASTTLIAGLLGVFLGGAVGALDALLNAVGFQRLLRVAVCLGVGGLGGMLSGLIGESLHQVLQNGFVRVVGWTLVGLSIGVSVGVYDLLASMTGRGGAGMALKKILNGTIGGVLGGGVGGVLFVVLVTTLVGLMPWKSATDLLSPLAFGLVVLGLCIGLFIGLAQVILKEAWLKVESGFRAGREVILTREETKVGRAESCDIGLFGDAGIEKLHARIVRQNDRYLLADGGTPGGTYLNDERVERPTPLRSGDRIRVGKSTLRFGERQKRK